MLDTVPTVCHVPPVTLYSQEPSVPAFAKFSVIAIPAKALESISENNDENKEVTVAPSLVAGSSVMDASLTL